MKEKEEKFKKQVKELNSMIPELELKRKLSKYKSEATIFKSAEGIRTAFRNIVDELNKGDEVHIMGVYDFGKDFLPLALFFQRIRSKKGIKAKFLMNSGAKNIATEFKKYPPVEIKYMPEDMLTPGIFLIYNDKVIVNLAKEKTFFVIQSKSAADTFETYFQMMWKQETRIVRGLDAVQDIFDEMYESGSCDFIGARGYFVDLRPKFIDKWEKRAIKSGFKMRNIVDIETKGHRITRFPFAKTKYIIPKEFSKLSVFWIYGNKIVITNWTEKKPIVLIIENKNLHDMYKEQFEGLWKKDKF